MVHINFLKRRKKNKMKTKLIFTNVLLMLMTLSSCDNNEVTNQVQFKRDKIERFDQSVIFLSKHDMVSTDSCAVQIAEIILKSFYGKEMEDEKPLRVDLYRDSIWIIKGSYTEDLNRRGGVAYIEIRKHDGKILNILHEQ